MIAPFPVRRTALAGLVALLTLPTAALGADSPTGGLDASTTSTAMPPTAPAPGQPTAPGTEDPAPTPTRATSELPGAGRWRVVPSAGTGSPLHVIGSFSRDLADRRVLVERRTASGWRRATSARVRSTGRFVARWRTRSTRVHELRVVLVPTGEQAAAPDAAARSRAAVAPSVTIAVLGRVKATWYGPGLWGNTTACGLVLEPDVVGVAHRTLPCGTQVEIRRGGRTTVVPVIDRGPYANGATFDMTQAAAERVGVDGVNRISWVLRDDLPVVATPAAARR